MIVQATKHDETALHKLGLSQGTNHALYVLMIPESKINPQQTSQTDYRIAEKQAEEKDWDSVI